MTLQDAQHDSPQPAFPALPATPIDLSEMPTNPLMPSLLPTDLAPIIPDGTAGIAGTFAANEIIVPDNSSPEDPLTPPVWSDALITTPMPLARSEILAPSSAPPTYPLAGPPAFAPMPPLFPPIPPTRNKRLDAKAILAICAAFLLLIISVGGLLFNFAYYQPYRAHTSATATAIVIPTTTARAEQTSVAISDHTQVAQQQATTSAEQNTYTQAISGKPFLSDSLKSPSANGWDEGVAWQNSSCTFKNGSYVVYQPNVGYFLPCFAENPTFISFALQVDVNVLQGDSGGVIFRADSSSGAGYIFNVDNYGNYDLYKYTTKSTDLFYGQTYDYQTDQKNRLTIIARGNTFFFYLNQHFVDSTTDKTFGEGNIGLIASDSQNATTIAYSNLKVWLLA